MSQDLLMTKWERCGFVGTKDIKFSRDHPPETVRPEVVVVGGAEIMEL
ncbi:hypothetical protein [Candidatus Nitrospira allomarina]|uniref:Uncharacterized protein n=1 Tax=Candidatus Nitrospira allomarina TaxID=3020900 RepID=A0AA96GE89_9BACT|nr:hypothetical protein [Candidatus Nitrospira allomarina]WNM60051.1 hypothetical protein PP769_09925 [Candidatus Nitrospira allomarina]